MTVNTELPRLKRELAQEQTRRRQAESELKQAPPLSAIRRAEERANRLAARVEELNTKLPRIKEDLADEQMRRREAEDKLSEIPRIKKELADEQMRRRQAEAELKQAPTLSEIRRAEERADRLSVIVSELEARKPVDRNEGLLERIRELERQVTRERDEKRALLRRLRNG